MKTVIFVFFLQLSSCSNLFFDSPSKCYNEKFYSVKNKNMIYGKYEAQYSTFGTVSLFLNDSNQYSLEFNLNHFMIRDHTKIQGTYILKDDRISLIPKKAKIQDNYEKPHEIKEISGDSLYYYFRGDHTSLNTLFIYNNTDHKIILSQNPKCYEYLGTVFKK